MTNTVLIESFIEDAKENSDFARNQFGTLHENALNWRVKPDEWSIAQCIQHITMVATHWVRQFEKISKKKLLEAPNEKFSMGILSRYLLKVITPQVKIKLRSPSSFEPHHLVSGRACMEEFYEVQERMISYAEKFYGIHLSEVKMVPPQFSLVHVNAGEALILYNNHVRRHLIQATNIKEHLLFPFKK